MRRLAILPSAAPAPEPTVFSDAHRPHVPERRAAEAAADSRHRRERVHSLLHRRFVRKTPRIAGHSSTMAKGNPSECAGTSHEERRGQTRDASLERRSAKAHREPPVQGRIARGRGEPSDGVRQSSASPGYVTWRTRSRRSGFPAGRRDRRASRRLSRARRLGRKPGPRKGAS